MAGDIRSLISPLPITCLALMLLAVGPIPQGHAGAVPASYPVYVGNLTLTWTYSTDAANLTTYQGEPLLSWEVCPRSVVGWQTVVSYWYNASPLVPSASTNNNPWVLTYSGNAVVGYTAQNTLSATWAGENNFATLNSQIVNMSGYQFTTPNLTTLNITELNPSGQPKASWLASAYIRFAPCFNASFTLSNTTPMAGQYVWANATFSGGFSPIASLWDVNGTYPCVMNTTSCRFAAPPGLNNVTLLSHDSSSFAQDDNDRNVTHTLDATTITLSARLSAPTKVDATTLFNASVVATGGLPPYTYHWTFNGTTLPNTTASVRIPSGTPGSPILRAVVTDSASHTIPTTDNITVVPRPVLTLSSSGQDVLPGTAVNLTTTTSGGVGPYAWNWTLNGSALPDGNPYLPYVPKGVGNYSFGATVRDADGVTSTASFLLHCIASPLPLHLNVSGPNITEQGVVFRYGVSVSGGVAPYRILWNSTVGNITSNGNTTLLAPMQNGTLFITITDAHNDTIHGAMDITVYPTLRLSGPSSFQMPMGKSIVLHANVTGGREPYVETWWEANRSVGSGSAYNFTPIVTGLVPFRFVVSDSIGVVLRDDFNVTVVSPDHYIGPTLRLLPSFLSVDSGTEARFNLSVQNGTAPYVLMTPSVMKCTMAGSDGACFLMPPNVSSPGYDNLTLRVTDVYGYGDNATLSMNVYPGMTLAVRELNGTASVVITGGKAPYHILWTLPSGSSTAGIVNMSDGTWSVRVTDANHATKNLSGVWAVPSSVASTKPWFNAMTEALLVALIVIGVLVVVRGPYLLDLCRNIERKRRHRSVLTLMKPEKPNSEPTPPLPPKAEVVPVEDWDETNEPEPKVIETPMSQGERTCPSCHHVSQEPSETCPKCFAYYVPPKGVTLRAIPRRPTSIEVRTIGETRSEKNPFGDAVRPEDVNPNVVHLDPKLLQPMEMEIRQDRGVQAKPSTGGEDPEEKTRLLMERARKAKETKAQE